MSGNASPGPTAKEFLDALPEEAWPLLKTSRGTELVDELGIDVVRGVVLDVLRGVNIRESTEPLTRRRLSLLNAAMIAQYAAVPGPDTSLETFLDNVAEALGEARTSASQKWSLNWALGLNEKAKQNVLRDDPRGSEYVRRYAEVLKQSAETASQDFGELSGYIKVGDKEMPLNWFFVLYLSASIGAQTLTIRGSEKALYGKLFEKLVLGAVLSVLGFRFVPGGPQDPSPGQFWLSTRSKRESDATLLISSGQGVRFDIGFIGRGNPEIALDKVSRFEREAEFSDQPYGMSTLVIVDRIGRRSRLEHLAEQIEGKVIQMSMTYWPQVLARHLNEKFGSPSDEILSADHRELNEILKQRIVEVPLEQLLQKAEEEEKED